MPTYEITTPDGGTFDVTAPEGASEADVLAYAKTFGPEVLKKQRAQKFAGREDPENMGVVERFLGAAKHSWDQGARALSDVADYVPGPLTAGVKGAYEQLGKPGFLAPPSDEQLKQGKAFTDQAGAAGTAGKIFGDVVQTAPAGGLITRGLGLGTQALSRGGGALVRTLGELGSGATLGAAMSNPGERGTGAAFGAGGQAAGMLLSRVLGGMFRPLVTDEARALMDEGIQPTVGQSVGGAIGKTEEKLMSLPVVGDAIGHARNRALGEFNERAIQTAAPGVTGHGDEALSAARDAISAQYQRALGQLPAQITVEATPIIQAAVTAADDPALALSRDAQGRLLDYVERALLQRQRNITPEVAKRIESDLGAAIARLSGSSTAEDRAMADALRQVHTQWRDSLTGLANQVSPGAGTALREADAAWRAFVPLDTAASRAGAQGAEHIGEFTPRALRRAIEASDKSINNRATRLGPQVGNAPFQRLNRLSRAGEVALSGRYPDSGSAGRFFLNSLAGGGAVSGLATGNPAALGALAAGTAGVAGSTRAGQQFLTQGLDPAIDALIARGIPLEQARHIVQQYGPDIAMSLARAGAANQAGAAHAP